MRGQAARLLAGVLALALPGCASTSSRFPVRGHEVEVATRQGESHDQVKGELLAVSPDLVLVLGPKGIRKVPRPEIERVRVRLHDLDGRKAGIWVVAGALVTGVALAAACAAVEGENNCGAAFAMSAVGWGLIGGPSAVSLGKSSRLLIAPPELDALRPYARFPQGVPVGLDPDELVVAPGKVARGVGSAPPPPRP